MHPHLCAATYRRAGQRGRASHAVFDTRRHADPKAALAALLGEPLSAFGVEGPDEPNKMEGQ